MISIFPHNRLTDRRNAIKSKKVNDVNNIYCISCYKKNNLKNCYKCNKNYCNDCLLTKYSSLYCYECNDKITFFNCCYYR